MRSSYREPFICPWCIALQECPSLSLQHTLHVIYSHRIATYRVASRLLGKFDQPTFQLAQASLLMQELKVLREQQPGLPIVVCGDFNSNRKSLIREYMLFGMPGIKGDATELALPADGPFSEVWANEFNKKFATVASVGDDGQKILHKSWTDDSYPWQNLWFNDSGSPFGSKRSDLVPLLDAFDDLHSSELAFTVPGEKTSDGTNLLLDHMCVLLPAR
jgi:hypothetical protein